ncbi:MAG: hypothetical protein ACRDHZ_10760, partial [Ktedonobacteraceae bacterium]
DYFEQRQDWEILSEILDGHSSLQFRCGETSEAKVTIQRRLQLTGLSFNERADATSSLTAIALLSGDYAASINTIEAVFDNIRPGEPLEVFVNALNGPMWALYLTGRWSEDSKLRRALDEIWRRMQGIEGDMVIGSYLALLMIALAREDQAEFAVIDAILRQARPEFREKEVLPFVAMYRDGDFSHFEAGRRGSDVAGVQMMFFSEHEQYPPDEVMQHGNYYADDLTLRASNIAQALMANDNAALARAIDEAEEHELIVHAARMRIVLAKRTNDLSQLERARAVLERLGDRLFLRKLHEVEAMLQTS